MAGKTNALQKPVNLSSELENVVGKGPMTRAQVTSKVWEYIKANDLQDSKDKRQINPDAKLGAVIVPLNPRYTLPELPQKWCLPTTCLKLNPC